ncbi:uncharacterized protein N7477_006247 [Penicillium maclennaniae]|uniref:uncharacterized protein n=1 Tax=Penicillium maclennaniae TaxID=1343394 RepID=UPI0025423533|nr:uncharacterized protein N7477_006247 [Penicillium maclennaniae]KAJ5667677.1 hypothetical protein N7477_006247 [Penicillium maclennaniae]
MGESSSSPKTGWRIPKACQECRKRKIRCNGLNPRSPPPAAASLTVEPQSCQTCEKRSTPCVYRDVTRHRRKKHEYQESRHISQSPRGSPGLTHHSTQRNPSVLRNIPNSVSATHMASPSCQMQLYYGPTSHFALMQHVYRDLISNPVVQPEPSGGVDEAGAGLDLFSFRRIFFGTPDESSKASTVGDVPVMFLPHELAKVFLSRFLTTLYHMMPHRPKSWWELCLEELYNPSPSTHSDILNQALLLLALGTGSLGTEYFAWGDVLLDRVKASLPSFDDVNEQGRPNAAFLCLGTASRKALSAGLHKDVPYDIAQTPENIEERRVTFWSILPLNNRRTLFLRLLVQLCMVISRSSNEIYGEHHESLLHMWRVARSISDDLRELQSSMQHALGFGLDAEVHGGSTGVKQIIFTTLYYHTLLLTFRPFLIFRGHWKRDMKASFHHPVGDTSNRPTEMPSWLNEACKHALTAARQTIHHLCDASRTNDHVKQLRYHGYFIASSAFSLIYDFLHDPSAAASHLPWVYASLQNLSSMREGDPITSTISAIQTVLRNLSPTYEWLPYPKPDNAFSNESGIQTAGSLGSGISGSQQGILNEHAFSPNALFGSTSNVSPSKWNPPQLEGPETGRSGGSSEDLLDLTQSDMGWNFDFSTMDLEAFFSVYQSADASFP